MIYPFTTGAPTAGVAVAHHKTIVLSNLQKNWILKTYESTDCELAMAHGKLYSELFVFNLCTVFVETSFPIRANNMH